MLIRHTRKALATYKEHISGVTFDVNFPIALIPPIIVNQVIIATIVPKTQPLLAKILLSPPVTSVNCAVIAFIWNKFQPPIIANIQHTAYILAKAEPTFCGKFPILLKANGI